jgi:hypothetical protein
VSLCIDESLPPGLQHLTLVGCLNRVANIAGLPVVHGDVAPMRRDHSPGRQFALDVIGVDHVVVLADDVRATCMEITRVSGAELKRVKEGERGIQGFHRWGSVILEVVERRLVQPRDTTPDGVTTRTSHAESRPASDATYWGLVLIVNDITAVCAHLGPDVIGAPKPAVQPGRLIATVRSGAGLGVPLALMSH